MKNLLKLVCCLTLFVVFGGVADVLAIEAEITAQVRSRTEINLHRGAPDTSAHEDTLNVREYLRTRLNFNLVKDENTRAFIQLQDSRVYGGEAGTSGGLTNDMNLGVHQAFIEFDHWLWNRFKARVGRQEITYGNHRLIGNVGWSNVGRAFDGGKVALAFEKVTLEAAMATMTEKDPEGGQAGKYDDNILAILAVLIPQSNVEFLLIGEMNGDRDSVGTDVKRKLSRATLSAYSSRKFADGFDYTANLAFQAGKLVDSNLAGVNVEKDIEAFMAAAELGYTLKGKGNARFALGVDMTSGDDGKDSTKVKEFNNLYYTGHKFRGHMDNFLAPNGLAATGGKGLMNLMVRGAVNFHPSWRVGADLHMFQTAQDYVSMADASLVKTIGSEIDFWVKSKEYRGVIWQYGVSVFSWKEDYVGPDAETTQFWAYAQATMNLK